MPDSTIQLCASAIQQQNGQTDADGSSSLGDGGRQRQCGRQCGARVADSEDRRIMPGASAEETLRAHEQDGMKTP